MSKAIRIFVILSLVLHQFAIVVQMAQAAPDPAVEAAADFLKSSIAPRLAGLAGLDELSQVIPLSALTPSDDQALNLDSLFTDIFSTLGSSFTSPEELAAQLDALDDTDVGGVAVTVDDVIAQHSGDFFNVSFTVNASRTFNNQLTFSHGEVNLDGSAFDITFTLSAPLSFRFDKTLPAANPDAFYFLGLPALNFGINAGATLTDFSEQLGFTTMTAGGSAALNIDVRASLVDPDSNGRITVYELSTTDNVDLFNVSYVDEPGDAVNILLNLDTDLTATSPDGSVTWQAADLSAGSFPAPVATLGILNDFTNIQPAEMLGGLNKTIAALLSAQGVQNMDLPFLQQNFSDILKFADPLIKFVKMQGEAAILCGTQPGDPPSIDAFGMPAGTTVYCQAISMQPATQVNWTVGGNPADADGTNLSTIGTNPTGTTQLTLTAGGMNDVQVEFKLSGEQPGDPLHLVRPLFRNAQQLAQNIASLIGAEGLTAVTGFDAETHSLTYRLQWAADPAAKQVDLDFGDQLTAETGLIGLSPAAGADVSIDAANAALDITFGAILVKDVNDIKPGGSVDDRFFIKVRNGLDEHEFQADGNVSISTPGNVALAGRLGFLEVTASGDSTLTGNIFSVGRSSTDPGTPMLVVDINAPGVNVGGSSPFVITDAVLLTEMLTDLGDYVSGSCNVGLSAGIKVTASVGSSIELASGKVGIEWLDVFPTGCTPDPTGINVSVDTDFGPNLQAFDIDPANPAALLSLILDGLDILAGSIDSLPGSNDLDSKLPLVDASPRDLLMQMERLQEVINELRSSPPNSLQKLETTLENELGIGANTLNLQLVDQPGSPAGNDLVIRLGYGICGTTGAYVSCEGNEKTVDPIDENLNFDLGASLPDFVSIEADASFKLEFDTGVQFDIGIPLDDPTNIFVIDTTGASLEAAAASESLGFSASLGPLTGEITGTAKVGGSFVLGFGDGTPENETFAVGDLPGALTASLDGPASPFDCGMANGNAMTGDACAALGLTLAGEQLGTIGFRVEDFTVAVDNLDTYESWFITYPISLTTKLTSMAMDWTLLIGALPELLTELENQLNGGASDVGLPLVGDSLAAGADVVGAINDNVVTPISSILDSLGGLPDVKAVEDMIRSQLVAMPLLIDLNSNGNLTDDVTVTAFCNGTTECADGAALTAITDIRVDLAIGQGVSGTSDPGQGCDGPACLDTELPFNIGLPGVPLGLEGNIKGQVGWKVKIGFGLSRDEGPYIITSEPNEVMVGASVTMGDAPGACSADDDPFPSDMDGDYSTTRCMAGKLGFLAINVNDGNEVGPSLEDDINPTQIRLLASLDLESSGGKLTLSNLVGGDVDLSADISAEANIDIAIRTGINIGETAGLPSIVSAFHLYWDITGGGDPKLAFDSLYLDAGDFVGQFLGPVVREVKKITSPLKPVLDTIAAPIPVVSDLAELVGEDPVTMISLMEAVSGSDLSLVKSIIAFLNFVNNLPEEGTFIPLGEIIAGARNPGSFELNASQAKLAKLTPDKAGDLIKAGTAKAGDGLMNEIGGSNKPLPDSRPGTFGVPGLTFPFMDNASNIFKLLLGQDVTIVRYDAGTMRATAGMSYSFGPIFVGPIPISIGLSGSITLEGRFALGYDTSGLRKVISGGSGAALLDGIFIDDLDIYGVDVPEVRLIGTVAVSAGIDFAIVAAGVEGGIQLTLDLNLNDSPEPDGKLRIEEILHKLQNPICLFDVSGRLDAYLAAWVRIGFWIFSKTFRIEIVRITLLDFSASCSPPSPELAENVGGVLMLNMGTRASLRHIYTDEEEEAFTVRQLTLAPPHRFSVTAFGITMEYPKTSGGPAITKIWADAYTENDTIALEPGQTILQGVHNGADNAAILSDSTADFTHIKAGAVLKNTTDNSSCLVAAATTTTLTCKSGASIDWDASDKYEIQGEIPFTTPAELIGGDGNDELRGGGGNDLISGGAGNDKVSAGKGIDTIHGGDHDDVLSGELGDDTINGDGGNDALIGGPGTDTLRGGVGDDELLGGLGTEKNPDAKDYLYGGEGNDSLEGDLGDDELYGDEELACADEGANTGGVDQVIGGAGDDKMYGGYANDTMIGEEGHDTICGNAGDDFVDGDDDTQSTADGNDILDGGSGNDEVHGRGGDDDIFGKTGDDTLFGEAGNDDLSGGLNTNPDVIDGGDGHDYIFGDDGSAVRPAGSPDATSVSYSEAVGAKDILRGGAGDDVMYGEGGPDEMFGDAGDDIMRGNDGDDIMRGGADDDVLFGLNGDDDLYGDSGDDDLFGGLGIDEMFGGMGIDSVHGDENNDVLYGDPESDFLYGDEGDDEIYGFAGDDYLEGNQGSDTIYGGEGQDDIIGGSAVAGTDDGKDFLYGGEDQDVILGDNGTITRPGTVSLADDSVNRTVVLFDLADGSIDTSAAGMDLIYGEAGNDDIYGGGEVDTLYGGPDDDYIEGNGSGDELYGSTGQDDLIGGTSQEAGGTPDGADQIYGSEDYDVIAGDNALITRPLGLDDMWKINTFNAAVTRQLTLFDVAEVGEPLPAVVAYAGDLIYGGLQDDLLYGQDGNDEIRGGDGEDYIEGNNGQDKLYGENGNDDMVGGTGRINADPATGTNGRLDMGETEMYGGAGFDYLAGDNAIILRTLAGGQWVANTFNGGIQHEVIRLLDVNSPDSSLVGGGDLIHGDGEDDYLYGQAEEDTLFGDAGDDYLEGNVGDDTLYGGIGQDDMLGGTGRINDDPESGMDGRLDGDDYLFGETDPVEGLTEGSGGDVMLGDNGVIARPLGTNGAWLLNTFNGIPSRNVILRDVETLTNPVNAALHGDDRMWGNDNDDVMYGQGGNDQMHGGAGDDYMEGNAADDIMTGDSGQDDMLGGTGRINNDPPQGMDGRLDGADWMAGENDNLPGEVDASGSDAMLGDNGVIFRPLDANGAWIVNSFNGSYQRVQILRDVETLNNPVNPDVHGGDTMYGNDNDDLMYGQGDEDYMRGGAGDDYMEGNSYSDSIFGDGQDDDILGGSGPSPSNDPSAILAGRIDASTRSRLVPMGAFLRDVPLGDQIYGGAGSDVILGDNGLITRPLNQDGTWKVLSYNLFLDDDGLTPRHETGELRTRIDRLVMNVDLSPGRSAGSDLIYGDGSNPTTLDDGDDDLYGQFDDQAAKVNPAIGDELLGEGGEDAMVGDNGVVISRVILDASQFIRSNEPFLDDDIYIQGTLFREVTLDQVASGGDDRMTGGDQGDWMHGGAGSDLMNGNIGNDRLFGADGDDAMWGGPHHDHLYGGHGDDNLDIKPRSLMALTSGQGKGKKVALAEPDPLEWFAYADSDNYQDIDYIYGGWDQDAMQADVAVQGPHPGDRLIDWVGAYNVYYVCTGGYGEYFITRDHSPSIIRFLQALALSDGAADTSSVGTSGFVELGLVFPKEGGRNAHPVHPDNPGHFTCSP